MEDIISIIIPVYNTEEYLPMCLESILNQTYHKLDIILIDDGSDDNSLQICNEYAKKDNRITVLNQKNVGSQRTRKNGLMYAKGNYVGFVDSDDWIEPYMYEKLYEEILSWNANVVTSYVCKEYANRSIIVKDVVAPGIYRNGGDDKIIYHRLMNCGDFTEGGFHASLCTKLFEMNTLRRYTDDVDDRIVNGDDASITYPLLANVDTICVTDYVLYHYRMRDTSITHTNDERYFERTNILYLYLKECFEKHKYSELLLKQLDKYLLNQILTGLLRRYNIDAKRIYQLPYHMIKKNSRIILYGSGVVGQSYYEQLKESLYCKMVLWVDKEYKKYRSQGLPVDDINQIAHTDADYILLAISDSSIAAEIKYNLEINDKKHPLIVWDKPKIIYRGLIFDNF